MKPELSIPKDMRVVVVLPENEEQNVAIQLRDNIESLWWPDRWGLFGGHVEINESPQEATIREIFEELSIKIDLSRLTYLNVFCQEGYAPHHVFHYKIKNEFENIVLGEGQRWTALASQSLINDTFQDKKFVPLHLDIIKARWRQHGEQLSLVPFQL